MVSFSRRHLPDGGGMRFDGREARGIVCYIVMCTLLLRLYGWENDG